jgi:tetratricopeptide (TPR) repeat protein
MMNNLIRSLCLATAALASVLVCAQGGKDIRPIPPETLRKLDLMNEATDRAEALLAKGLFDEAIWEFRRAVEIQDTIPGWASTTKYNLAKALVVAGRNEEAMEAFAKAVMWDEKRGDWYVNGPPAERLAMDYAILAAKQGDERKAKEMYYFGLRNFNPFGEAGFEAMPFIVVFDPDPLMEVWEYSPEALTTAALMAHASHRGTGWRELVQEVRRRKPDWMLPIVFESFSYASGQRDEMLGIARGLAKSEREIMWLEQVRNRDPLHKWNKVGADLRRQSTALAPPKRQ